MLVLIKLIKKNTGKTIRFYHKLRRFYHKLRNQDIISIFNNKFKIMDLPYTVNKKNAYLTINGVLIIIGKDISLNNFIVCKYPLSENAYKSLKANFEALKQLNSLSNIILSPKALTDIEIPKTGTIFIESYIEGINWFEILQKNSLKSGYLMEQALTVLKNNQNHFNQFYLSNNEKYFISLENKILKHSPTHIVKDLQYVFEVINKKLGDEKILAGFSHGDFWPGNIIYDKNNYQLNGIIDWDRFNLDAPLIFDEIHLTTTFMAAKNDVLVGEQIIDDMSNDRFDYKTRLLYWLQFILNSINYDLTLLSNKRWVKRNILNVTKYISKKFI